MKYFIYCLFVALPIYQDSPLSNLMGAFGYSILPVLSIIFLPIYISFNKYIYIDGFVKILLKLELLLIITTIISMLIWSIFGDGMYLYGEFLPLKAIKVNMEYISYICYMIIMTNLSKKVTIEKLERPFIFIFFLLIVIAIVESMQIPYALRSIHYSGIFPYYRIRLLTTEASWTSMMISVYSTISIHYSVYVKKSKLLSVMVILSLGYLLIISGSKTLILMIFIAVILSLFQNYKNNITQKKIINSFFILVIGIILFQKFAPNLFAATITDINEYTSLATRVYTGAIGLLIGILIPVGIGMGIYLVIFPNLLTQFLWIFDKLPVRLNTSEIINYINSDTDVGLSVKSGILQYNMYWGIIGTMVFLIAYCKLGKSIFKNEKFFGKNLYEIGLALALIMVVFTSKFSFEFWLLISTVISLKKLYRS